MLNVTGFGVMGVMSATVYVYQSGSPPLDVFNPIVRDYGENGKYNTG